eukprot:167774_1
MAHWCFILSVCVVRSSRFLLSNDWSALEWVDLDVQLPRASVWMAVASYNNSIFIFGGQGETDSFVNQAVKFDLLSLTITDLGMDYLPFGLDGTSKYYTQINHLFYAIDHVSNPSHIIGYNLITKHESNTKPMSQYVGLYGCLSSMDDLLFVIGGYDGVALSSTQIYNTSSQNWTIGPPMNKARRYHTCVVDWIDSVLYAIGGWSSTAASTVERISIHMMLLSEANTSWNYIQSLSEGVPAASSLMVPSTHQIFVFFGYSSAPLQIIDCDSGTTASLSEQSTMYGVAALFVSNTIYAFGGREGQETSTCQTMDLLATKNPTTGSTNPSADPTSNPTNPSTDPTDNPSANPSKDPTNNPSSNPSTDPTNNPSSNPSQTPTEATASPITADPTTGTDTPTSVPSRLPTQVTDSPTLDTASPTGSPSQVPTEVTGSPVTAAPTALTYVPTETTSGPTRRTTAPTRVSASPTRVSSSPTGVSPSPTRVPSVVLVLSSTAVPTCPTDDECNEDECDGECHVLGDCNVCVSQPQGSLANTYRIGVTVWIGFVTYVLQ